jgi:arsenate reductase
MSLTIYHNPRCSKSRKTLELIQEAGVHPNIVDYLSEPPSAARILQLAELLGLTVQELLRRNEADFKDAADLPDLDDNAALAAWVANHPKVLERPIVVDDGANRAVMGRPPENVRNLLP